MSYTPPQNPLQDPALAPYHDFLVRRSRDFAQEMQRITETYGSLRAYADLYKTFGLHLVHDAAGGSHWRWREYMPHAEAVWLTTSRLNFQRRASHRFEPKGDGVFELTLPREALDHGEYVELRVQPQGSLSAGLDRTPPPLRRVPAFAQWVEQDKAVPEQWCARVWCPSEPYQFQHRRPGPLVFPRI
ncbi:MAG: hypothetical protein K2G99_03145 [Desulfovibrio sp.]|nr:hypothetical protein [Desulfovibrio sp.]